MSFFLGVLSVRFHDNDRRKYLTDGAITSYSDTLMFQEVTKALPGERPAPIIATIPLDAVRSWHCYPMDRCEGCERLSDPAEACPYCTAQDTHDQCVMEADLQMDIDRETEAAYR